MVLISHRGNINGKIEEYENYPPYIDSAIKLEYDVEIDVWFINDEWWLGHDEPQHKISVDWLEERQDKLWIHCKNVEAVVELESGNKQYDGFNFFWHENDTLTLTSLSFIWVYPGKQPIKGSIAVMPEIYNEDVSQCYGVCSDYIEKYKKNENID
jgi:hypothetical protein